MQRDRQCMAVENWDLSNAVKSKVVVAYTTPVSDVLKRLCIAKALMF